MPTAEYHGLTHECDNPDCHVPAYVETLRRRDDDERPDDARSD